MLRLGCLCACAGLQVYDVLRAAQCCCGSLVLSPGASLAWLGFSREGLLAAMDRCGAGAAHGHGPHTLPLLLTAPKP
jgi:hypothetical protein